MTERVFNVGMLEVAHGFVIAGKRWIQLRFGYAGDNSPLVVQMPEKAWADAMLGEEGQLEEARQLILVNELTAQRDAFGQKAHQLQEEVFRVRALLHRDRTGLAEAIERMVKEAAKEEAGAALRAVIEVDKKALTDSGDNTDSAFHQEAPKVVMWGDRKMKEGRCPPGNTCLACDRLGKHLEPAC